MPLRNTLFDGLKFLLIVLVIIGHVIEYYKDSNELLSGIYTFLYSFHMPLFIFISGYFSKNLDIKKVIKGNTELFVAFLLFELVWVLYPHFVFGYQLSLDNLISPKLSLWYLLSLICWRFMAALLVPRFKKAPLVIFSFMLACAVGFLPFIDRAFSLSRTFVFFPFFLLGLIADQAIIDRIRDMKHLIPLLIIGAVLCLSFYINKYMNVDLILFGSRSYSVLSENLLLAAAYRIISMIVALQMIFTIINLVPDIKWMASMGKNTLIFYILHGPLAFDVLPILFEKLKISPNLLHLTLSTGIIILLIAWLSRFKIVHILVNPLKYFRSR